MGSDKAVLRVSGSTLLERAVADLESIAAETLLACGPSARYAELGRPLVTDRHADGGPLAGIEAALARARTEWLAVLACDMPRADPRVLLAVLERAEKEDLDGCFLETANGVEPLCAVYRRTCLASMSTALASGERKITSFLRFAKASGELPRVGRLPESELPAELAGRDVARNLNTPEDLITEIAGPSRLPSRIGGLP
jgi:molybdopterin-guanine dinucleotide biosynthesis protein A